MRLWVLVLLVVVFGPPLWIALRRSTELFVLRVRDGETQHVRGRLPPMLLQELREILATPPVSTATVRVVRENGRPRVLVTGPLGEAQVQRLRNVVGRFPLAQILGGRPPRR